MIDQTNLASLIEQRKYLKENGWKEASNSNELLEQFIATEQKIANTNIKTKYEAYLQINLLKSLWKEARNSYANDDRAYIIDCLFESLLRFFR